MEPAPETTDAIHVETQIEASPAAVWRALTDRIGDWWPDASFAAGGEGERTFRLEAHPGGRMYEDWSDGSGLLWGTVVTLVPERMLQVAGYTFPEWGGPSTWFGTWKLEGDAETCTLRFTHDQVGATAEGWQEKYEGGWVFLWTALKAHLEGKPPPKWEP